MIIDRFGKQLERLVGGSALLNFGRAIMSDWVRQAAAGKSSPFRILDIGCGVGDELVSFRAELKKLYPDLQLELYGVEFLPESIQAANQRGITIIANNLEVEKLSKPDGFFDLVIANQILEHTKDVFWICSEVSRVLKPGGQFLVGVPNLASLHNRFLLLAGEQPTTLETLSAHVRGFTKPTFRRFIQADGYFQLAETRGSNFYPFPPTIAKRLAAWLPTMAVTLFFRSVRTDKAGTFIQVLNTRFYETNFYRGPDG